MGWHQFWGYKVAYILAMYGRTMLQAIAPPCVSASPNRRAHARLRTFSDTLEILVSAPVSRTTVRMDLRGVAGPWEPTPAPKKPEVGRSILHDQQSVVFPPREHGDMLPKVGRYRLRRLGEALTESPGQVLGGVPPNGAALVDRRIVGRSK